MNSCSFYPIDRWGKPKQIAAKMQIQAFQGALKLYRNDVGAYPTSAEELDVLWTNTSGRAGWAGPYLQSQIPLDPWGNAYIYRYSEQSAVEILSLGADGKRGGTGENSDIGNQIDSEMEN